MNFVSKLPFDLKTFKLYQITLIQVKHCGADSPDNTAGKLIRKHRPTNRGLLANSIEGDLSSEILRNHLAAPVIHVTSEPSLRPHSRTSRITDENDLSDFEPKVRVVPEQLPGPNLSVLL